MSGRILHYLKQATFFGGGIAAHHYGSEFLENIGKTVGNDDETIVRKSLESVERKVDSIVNGINALNKAQHESIDKNPIIMEQATIVSDNANTIGNSVKLMNENGPTKDAVDKLTGETNTLIENMSQLMDLIFGKPGGSGSSNYSFILDSYQEYIRFLDSLTLLQESAFIHILFFSYILMSLFSFIGVFFGNELIKYFDLENKNTYLSRFLKLRAKYQRYYLLWNLFTVFVVCIVALFLNILAFTIKIV